MISAAVLTWNPAEHSRMLLLADTIHSLREADRLTLIDNGSKLPVSFPDIEIVRNDTWNTTSGYGTWTAMRSAAAVDGICVVSDDDMWWRPGWAGRLTEWWKNAPSDLLLTGCHLEPEYPWNTIENSGAGWLHRASTGAASWSFRSTDLARIRELVTPIAITRQGVWDVPVCNAIRAAGFKIAQLDLAEHVGEQSTWGNGTVGGYGWDVGPVRELIRA